MEYSALRLQCGIYLQEKQISSPTVLYLDSSGWWAPLSHMYFSRSGNRYWLTSRHVENVTEDIIGRFCPQCSVRYTGDDAMSYQNKCISCFKCPWCASPLSVVALGASHCAFQCGYCMWRSDSTDSPQFIASDKRELESSVLIHERELAGSLAEAFSAILFRSSCTLVPDPGVVVDSSKKGCRWGLADLAQKLQLSTESLHLSSIPSGVESSLVSTRHDFVNTIIPRRVELLSKRTLRSKLDVHQGRMKILVQPKPNPMDGDSSQKNRGAWWVMDSSAIHELPRISILRVPTFQDLLGRGEKPTIVVMIHNPRDSETSLRLTAGGNRAKGSDGLDREHCPVGYPTITLSAPSSGDQINTTTLVIGAYVDEFLREEGAIISTELEGTQWKAQFSNNTAKIWIPVDVLSLDLSIQKYYDIEKGRLKSNGVTENVLEEELCGKLYLSFSACNNATPSVNVRSSDAAHDTDIAANILLCFPLKCGS